MANKEFYTNRLISVPKVTSNIVLNVTLNWGLLQTINYIIPMASTKSMPQTGGWAGAAAGAKTFGATGAAIGSFGGPLGTIIGGGAGAIIGGGIGYYGGSKIGK
jgi:hypothetical protein